MKLLTDAANGVTGDWNEVPEPGNVHNSHVRSVYVEGTLDGGSVIIEAAHESWGQTPGTAATVATITANGVINISVRARQLRARTTGGGGSMSTSVIVV